MGEQIVVGEYFPAYFESRLMFEEDELRQALLDKKARGELALTACHEWVHFLQSILTSFGRYTTWTLRFEANATFRIVRHILSVGRQVLVPIFHNFGRLESTDLDKELLAVALSVRTRSLLHGNQSVSGGMQPSFYGVNPPRSLPSPVYESKGNAYVVSAMQIVEGHARACEVHFLLSAASFYGFDADEVSALLRQSSIEDPYEVVLLVLSESLDAPYVEVLPLAQACCDIALCPPLINLTPGKAWEFVHPGWRFMRVVDTLKSLRIPKDEFADSESMAETVCAEIGGGTPTESMQKWLDEDPFLQPYENDARSIREAAPFALSNLSKNLAILMAAFPLTWGPMGMENLAQSTNEIQSYSRDFFAFFGRIASFLFGGSPLSPEERKRLSSASVCQTLKESGQFDLDELLDNCILQQG